MWGEFAIFDLILHNTLHCTHAPLFQQEEERLCLKQLSDLAETFHKRTRETREQYKDVHAQVKELEQLRSQHASSGVVFNLSNNQAPLSDKLKSRRGRYRHGITLPQGGREATRQEMMHAYQCYPQAEAEDGPIPIPVQKQMMDLLHPTKPIPIPHIA
jgi:hypothetical protein